MSTLKRIDFEGKELFVMEKFENYGTWSDFVHVVRFYGLERFKKRIVYSALRLSQCLANDICPGFGGDETGRSGR